jgi:predicted heme/steroid binding protein
VCKAAPGTPSGVALAAKSTGLVVVTWMAPADPPNCTRTGYRVYLDGAEASAPTSGLAALTGLAAGSTHAVTVAAENEKGLSAQSAALSVTTDAAPDLGPNTHVYDPGMAAADIQADIDAVYAPQFSDVTGQFDSHRAALLFKPGQYSLKVPIGYYMQVAGLGALPDDTTITGVVTSYGHWSGDWGGSGFNSTQNFWRGVENFAVNPTNDTDPLPAGTPNTLEADNTTVYMRWAVSQACPFRRMHITKNLHLAHWGGWSSGGWISDSVVDGMIDPESQQQFFTRNTNLASWKSVNWNEVFVGVDHPFTGTWPGKHTTVIAMTPVVREKPFLVFDAVAGYQVFLPALRKDSTGPSWSAGTQADGKSASIDEFFVARPTDTAQVLNSVLAAGKNLLFTPGIYDLTDTLKVTAPNTVILGLGFATLHPVTGLPAMTIADVDGIVVAGLLFDAGKADSPVMLQVGETGASADHAENPTSLHDLFFRIGGAEPGTQADAGVIVNSNNVIGDHFWIWRADHGVNAKDTGWTVNPSQNGLVVNGSDVIVYGLFVEHFEKYQTTWNGENGRVYFYQSEIPYDVPDQASWMAGTKNGYASYKVADTVKKHEAWGLGVYSVFNVFDGVLDNAVEVPTGDGVDVKLHGLITFGLAKGIINNVVNDFGGPATSGATPSLGGWQQGVVPEYPVPPTPPPPPPAEGSLAFPLNFEATPNPVYAFPAWGVGAPAIVVDPDNAANHVLHWSKGAGDPSWSGFSITQDAAATIGVNVNPFAVSRKFSLKVKCSVASTPILLKFEKLDDGATALQVVGTTDATTAWQMVTFDFTAATVKPNTNYLKPDLFPGYDGTNGVGALTCDFDDLAPVTN